MSTSRTSRPQSQHQRESLLKCAASLFAEKGFKGTSIRMICSKANVNTAAVNYYFGSKEKLYVAVFRMLMKMDDASAAWLHEAPPPCATLTAWMGQMGAVLEKLTSFLLRDDALSLCRRRMLASELARPSQCLPMLLEVFYKPVITYLNAMFVQVLPDASPVAIQAEAMFMLNHVASFFRLSPPWDAIARNNVLPPDEWHRTLNVYFLNLLQARLREILPPERW